MNAPLAGPGVRRHRSKQDYETPREFIAAIERRFGPLAWDLAASAENAKAPRFFAKEDDALRKAWGALEGNLWLNPEFDDIAPWADLCAGVRSRPAWTLLLTPASPGSNWFQRIVAPHAHVLELAPRLSFDGKNPYPKDCVLSAFGFGITGRSFWRWDEGEPETNPRKRRRRR